MANYGASGGYTSLVKYSDTEIRKLTIIELKKIQTFPIDFDIKGSYNEMCRQIGNAVPPKLAYYIGIHLSNLLTDKIY